MYQPEEQSTTPEYHDIEASLVINRATGAMGGLIVLENIFILCLILRLLANTNGRKDNFCFLVHLLSVSINDILCGVMFLLIALIPLLNMESRYVCAYVHFCALALQTASQGNIVCVSAQRYVFSRKIRDRSLTWQMFHTKTLLAVNVIVAVGTFIAYVAGAEVSTDSLKDNYCYFANVLDGNIASLLRGYFIVGVTFTVLSDILCFLTIRKLRSKANVTVQPDISAENRSSTYCQHDLILHTTQARQKRAIFTIVLILVFFNLSVLPSLLGYVFTLTGLFSGYNPKRVLMITMFTNSLINPIIIVTRVKDMRTTIRSVFKSIRTYVVNRGQM